MFPDSDIASVTVETERQHVCLHLEMLLIFIYFWRKGERKFTIVTQNKNVDSYDVFQIIPVLQ